MSFRKTLCNTGSRPKIYSNLPGAKRRLNVLRNSFVSFAARQRGYVIALTLLGGVVGSGVFFFFVSFADHEDSPL